jgi:hypothetical protein
MKMDEDETQESIPTKKDLIYKIIIWFIVLFISLMLIILLIFQPRFYTFVNIIKIMFI